MTLGIAKFNKIINKLLIIRGKNINKVKNYVMILILLLLRLNPGFNRFHSLIIFLLKMVEIMLTIFLIFFKIKFLLRLKRKEETKILIFKIVL